MRMPYHYKTNKKTALNPVARAVAREKLEKAVLELKIRIFMMQRGEECSEVLEILGRSLGMVGYACELDPSVGKDDPRARIVRGGLSACSQMIASGGWDPAQAVALERALDEAQVLNSVVDPKFMTMASVAINHG